MQIDVIAPDEASALIADRHYLGALRFPPVICFATRERDAVAVYSYPVAASFNRTLERPLELSRLWQAPNADRQVSQFLSATLRELRKLIPDSDGVVSYADPAQGHNGTVYAAANFVFGGVRGSHVTDTWQSPDGVQWSPHDCYRKFRTKDRIKIAALNPTWHLVKGVPKLLFVYGLKITSAELSKRIRPPTPARRKLATQGGGFRNEVYRSRFPARPCGNCRQSFVAARADAKTCSPRCRTALHRRKKG